MKLRLLLWPDCSRFCEGCCNKDWDLDKLPYCESFAGYDEIMLTGGEPLNDPQILIEVIEGIRCETSAPIYVYTSELIDHLTALAILTLVDGMTVTLHGPEDVWAWNSFADLVKRSGLKRSLRLNVFKGIEGIPAHPDWIIKKDIEWIPNCPLPEGEVFMRWS